MVPSLLVLFSLQKTIHRNDGAESECTERDGWCLPKTSDDLRDTMSLMIKQIIRSTRPGKDALHITVYCRLPASYYHVLPPS